MPQYLSNDVALYVSKTLEASYNADVSTGSNYAKIRSQQAGFLLPQVEFLNDAGVPGNGHEFATTWCANYLTHPAVTFTDDVNYGIAGRLALRLHPWWYHEQHDMRRMRRGISDHESTHGR